MAGKWGWVLGLALAWTQARGAFAQAPDDKVGPDAAKTDAPPPAAPAAATAPAAPAPGASTLPTTYQPIQPTWYVKADYLLWWERRGPLPEQPLVTTGPLNGANAGIVGQPTTQTLFGSSGLAWPGSSGARFTLGFNLTSEGTWGIEGSGFFLPREAIDFSAGSSSPGNPLVTRPVYDNLDHVEAAYDVNVPGRVSGNVNIQATTEFWGYEINAVHHPVTANGANVDLFLGFRSMGLDERYLENSDLTQITPGVVTFLGQNVNVGDHVTTADSFVTTNRFYGPQIGGGFNWQWGRLGANLTGKVAAGVNDETETIGGVTMLIHNGAMVAEAPGGILAQKSNIGAYSQNVFCLVPELDLAVTYDITSWLRARLGYNMIYWSNVARPGSQIDRNIDITQVPSDQKYGTLVNGVPPPTSRPGFSFVSSDFWAQGLSIGLEVRY